MHWPTYRELMWFCVHYNFCVKDYFVGSFNDCFVAAPSSGTQIQTFIRIEAFNPDPRGPG